MLLCQFLPLALDAKDILAANNPKFIMQTFFPQLLHLFACLGKKSYRNELTYTLSQMNHWSTSSRPEVKVIWQMLKTRFHCLDEEVLIEKEREREKEN